MEAHDPSNNRTLDLSGNGRHLTLGNGGGGSVPTKLGATRGYYNSASNYLNRTGDSWSSNRITVEVMFQTPNLVGGSAPYVAQMYNASGVQFVIIWAAGNYRFYTGGTSANNASFMSMTRVPAGVVHIVGSYDGTSTVGFLNGGRGANAITPLAPVATASATVRCYQIYTGGGSILRGALYFLRVWDVALTDTEIQELYRKAKEELHRI